MDKYEYKVKSEEIKALIAEKDFAQAAEIADTIDWRRVKSVMMLCTISDLYKINRRYEDAKNMLLLAYDRRQGGRTICYSLCELCIKTGDYVQALKFYKEFTQVAPRDPGRYILQYKLYEAQDVQLEERIEVLEELKKRDYREKWAYELAYLYHRVGLATRCVEECDELVLWFGEGKYVVKALELKMLHHPLTPAQQEIYDRRFEKPEENAGPAEEYSQEEYYEAPAAEEGEYAASGTEEGGEAGFREEAVPEQTKEFEIQVKTVDVGRYNTINLQEELAAGLQEVLGADGPEGTESGAAPERRAGRTARGAASGGYGGQTGRGAGSNGYAERTEPGAGPNGYGEQPGPGAVSNGYAERTEPGAGPNGYGEQPGPGAVSNGYAQQAEGWEEIEGTEVFFGETGEIVDVPAVSGDEAEAARDSVPEEAGAGQEAHSLSGRAAEGDQVSGGTESAPRAENTAGTETVSRAENTPGTENAARAENTVGTENVARVENTPGIESAARTGNAAGQSPREQTVQPPRELADVLLLEPNGQIRMVLPEKTVVEKQITGQMKIEDILAEWERMKKENKEKYQEEIRKYVLRETGPMFTEFDAAVRDGLLEKLESGAPVEENSSFAAAEQEKEAAVDGEQETAGDGETGLPAEGTAYEGAGYAEAGEEPEENAAFEDTAYDGETEDGVDYQGLAYAGTAVRPGADGTCKALGYAGEQAGDGMDYEETAYAEAEEEEEYGGAYGEPEYAGDGDMEEAEAGGEYGDPGYAEAEEEEEYGGAYGEPEYAGAGDMEEAEAGGEYGDPGYAEALEGMEDAGACEEPEYAEEEAEYGGAYEEPEYAEAGDMEEAEAGGEYEAPESAEALEGIEAAGAYEDPAYAEALEGIEDSGIYEEPGYDGTGEEPEETADYGTAGDDRKTEGSGKQKNPKKTAKEGAAYIEEPQDGPQIERDKAKVRGLTREEKELFAPFIQSRHFGEQLVKAIDSISMAAYTGNVIVTGEEGMDTLTLAKNIIREVSFIDRNFSGKVAKITGKGLNGRNIEKTLEQQKNGALIIQKASGMSRETATGLHRALQQERVGIVVVLEDTKKAIQKLLLGTPELHGDFTARVNLEALSNDTLVAFGRRYAREKEHSIDDLGILALHTRIEENQTIDHVVTVIEVKQMVDEAIRHAGRKTLGHFIDILLARRYDDEDMIILTEKDFVA